MHKQAMLLLASNLLLAQTEVPDRVEAVRAVLARHTADQLRTLTCVTVMDPEVLEGQKTSWEDILGFAAEILERGHFPKPIIVRLLADSQPEARLPDPLDVEKTRASCLADKAWEDHLHKFTAYKLVGDVSEIVEGHR